MSRESVLFGVAGIFFGLLVGWIIGSQQAAPAPLTPTSPAQSANAPTGAQTAAPFDASRAAALQAAAERNPRDSDTRVQLGNLYFDAERYAEAVRWYEAALEVDPRNVDASTDLGICYYYMNQPDRALAQFDRSLALDPRHSKTLLNVGIVRAFGKEDLEGAAKAFEQVLQVAPDSAEARAAKQALDGIRSAHPNISSGSRGGKPSGSPE